jgi:hypothetical protein
MSMITYTHSKKPAASHKPVQFPPPFTQLNRPASVQTEMKIQKKEEML